MAHIHEAMHAVQAEMSKVGVGKDGYNQQQRFQFRAWDDVQQKLSPFLAKHKMLVIPHVTKREQTEHSTKSGGMQFKVVLSGEIAFVSGVDGSEYRYPAVGEGMDSGDKATSKALTMMVKYALLHGLQIPLHGVDDADAASPEETATEGPLADDLRSAATEGVAALKKAWSAIPKEDRPLYTALVNELKAHAEAADAAAK